MAWPIDYNTRIVLLGTVLLGLASGVLGVYLLLRRRVLIGDAISHATLPGVALAFLWTAGASDGKALGALLLGASISGGLGGVMVLALRHAARIREDAALGIVLSVFFGAGVALVTVVQQSGQNAAGLEAFIYGKAAAMSSEDAWLAAAALAIVVAAVGLLGKELRILCFDIELARSQGWPVVALDTLLIALVVMVTIVGLQAVGLILIIALLVIPAASARFWTHHLDRMMGISAAMGAVSCGVGTLLSAEFARLPSGATIVLVGCGLFLVSFAFGWRRGVVWRAVRTWHLRREQDAQHLLRAAFEVWEATGTSGEASGELKSSPPIALAQIAAQRHWTESKVRGIARRLARRDLLVLDDQGSAQLTPRGRIEATTIVREHRLLERYMIEEAAAPLAAADREADYLEHGLLPEHLSGLGSELPPLPPNPHGDEPDRG